MHFAKCKLSKNDANLQKIIMIFPCCCYIFALIATVQVVDTEFDYSTFGFKGM